MKKYIQTKVRSERPQEDGLMKQFIDVYLVQAESLTEAEERIMRETSGTVESATRFNVAEIIAPHYDPDNVYYKAKIEFVSFDERTGKERRKSHMILVQAQDVETAMRYINKNMAGTVSTYEVVSITKTAIIDIYELED